MDYRAKVSLIGDERTGKTSLILRYLKNTFTNEYITTLGADFIDKTYTNKDLGILNNDDELTITYWDQAGQSHFKQIAEIYCEGSAGMLIVFDVNEQESFNSVLDWVNFAKRVSPDAVLVIVGNKVDLETEVDQNEMKKLEEEVGVPIILTSAKLELQNNLSNVENVFEEIARKILEKHLSKNKD